MSRPDTALRRSDELLAVGQPAAALSSVSEIFSSKRFRSTPLSSLEPIVLRFLELCVMLRKGRTAKEGLHIYRNVAQNTSVTAVETVIRFFLDKSKEKLQEALAKVDEVAGPAPSSSSAAGAGEDATSTAGHSSTQMTNADGTIQTVEVEDLDAAETPESILLSAVSDDKSRDRTYRTLVTPWLRFLWEAYRTALDTLRNNARLEVLYQQVALEAFQFCFTHSRKTEFRRLSDMLRQHFTSSQKYAAQTYSINISDPETLQRHLDVRFAQLSTAVDMELWQEAFRSAEDIHALVSASKRTPRASMMASFYEKLVKVFAVGQNFLFHAAAYSKLHSLQAASTSLSSSGTAGGEQSDRIAGLVLLSALSVPLASSSEIKTRKDPITGEEKDYTRGRMTLMGLLDLPVAPTREVLLKDAIKRGVLKHVSPELRSLYSIIETDFHPLKITSKLEPIFAQLRSNAETARYIEPLKNVVLSRLFQQLAQVYDSVKLARVVKLASFKDDAEQGAQATKNRVEKFITDACRRGEMSVRLDHASGIVEFEDRNFQINDMEVDVAQRSSIDVLQPTPSTLLRTHLATLAQTLFTSLATISPDSSALALAKGRADAALKHMAANLEAERESLLSRRVIAEQRKYRAEAESARKEKEAEAARIAARQQQAATEAKRVENEARARQLELIRKNNEAIKIDEARKLADKLKAAGAFKVADKEIDTMDTAQLRRMQVEQMEKEQKALAEKLRIIAKRIDHTERAFRKEEIPLLHKDYELQQKRDRETYEQTRAQRLQDAQNAHAAELDLKKRLLPRVADFEAFKKKKLAAVSDEYTAKVAESKRKIEEEKQKRTEQVQREREEYRAERRRERERRAAELEAERRHAEEAARREKEERAAREAEEARLAEEKRAAEEEAARQKEARLQERMAADEVFRKQREREAEVERRQAEKEAARKANSRAIPGGAGWTRDASPAAGAGTASTPSAGPPRVPIASGKPSWRDREAAGAGNSAAAASSVPRGASPANGPGASASASASAGTGERRRLQLAPRSTPAPAAAAGAAPASKTGDEAEKKPVPAGGAYRPPGQRTTGERKW